MTPQLASTTQRPADKLSESFLVFHDKVTAKGFHFREKNFEGLWRNVPRCSAEHVRRLRALEDKITSLMTQGR